jgi:hypothetical protein
MRLFASAVAVLGGFLVFAVSTSAHAQQTSAAAQKLDAASARAAQETQALLGDQKAMQDYAKSHPDAAKAMGNVDSLTGGNAADSAAVYKLASDIFANMTKETGGDAGGMEKILAEAMKNPQAFANKLTPEQRAQLQSLTKSIESRAPTSNPH